MKLRLELDDGRVFEAEGNETTLFCLSDRVAFERRFGESAAAMDDWQKLFTDAEGNTKTVDKAALKEAGFREEWMLFPFYRELRRRAEGVPDWDEVMDKALDFDVESKNGDSSAVPTTGAS